MNNLIEQVCNLAQLPPARYGLLYQTPEGVYAISDEDGLTGSAANRYIISTNQLRDLLWDMGVRRDQLADPVVAARVAAKVAERRTGA